MSDDLSALRLIKHIITNFHPTYLCIYYSVEYSLEALAYFPLSIVITHYVPHAKFSHRSLQDRTL
jgi:hypothetical protein